MEQKKIKARYAVACSFTDDGDDILDELFFVTFHTRDEAEALDLAKCICGRKARKSLVIITEYGKVIPVL